MFLTRGFIFTYEAVREWEAKLTRTRAIDRDGALVDVMLSEHRNLAAAKAFFRSAKTVTGITPARVTTDGHDAYPLPFWRRHRLRRTRRTAEATEIPRFSASSWKVSQRSSGDVRWYRCCRRGTVWPCTGRSVAAARKR